MSRALVALTTAILIAGLGAQAVAVEEQPEDNALLLVMDASGSMTEPAGGGETRIAAAKDALTGLVDELPADARVGLRVYGATQDRGCGDTKLFEPISPLDRGRLKSRIRSFTPRGDTPIGPSLQAAANDLEQVDAENRTVVLVSDGEDTCSPPTPCQVARDIAQSGIDLRVESIGFQVGGHARSQLECVAKATGGSYHDAPDADTLTAQLQALSLRSFRGYRPTGEPVTGTRSQAGAPVLQPGAYVDNLAPGESKYYRIEVPAGGLPVVNAALIAGATQPRLGFPENFRVRVSTSGGQECAFGSVSETSPTFSLSATAAGGRVTGGAECEAPGPRTVMVERQLDGGSGVNTVELLYTLVPPLSEDGAHAPAVERGPRGGVAQSPTQVRGGTSYDSAPTIGDGLWNDTIRLTETLYYRVPVDWGQRLRVRATFRGLTAERGTEGFLQAVVEVRDALRVDPGARELVQVTSSGPRSVRLATEPVRAPSGDDVAPFRMAGAHYVVLNAADYIDSAKVATAAVELDVEVVGPSQDGPRFRDLGALGPQASPSPTRTSPPPPVADGPGASDDTAAGADGDDGGSPGVWLGLTALLLVAAGVTMALVLRRRRGGG